LLELGCVRLLGYLFSRPLPEDQFLAWLASRAGRPVAAGVTA
jgi:EAL domain-containing protein (putative c-di-GMP-specific phosphodiesterase class I)